jgi:hypothetical protein
VTTDKQIDASAELKNITGKRNWILQRKDVVLYKEQLLFAEEKEDIYVKRNLIVQRRRI